MTTEPHPPTAYCDTAAPPTAVPDSPPSQADASTAGVGDPIGCGTAPPAGTAAEPLLPRSFLRSFLLLALDRVGRSYGYELFETVQAQGLITDLAGVYRALRSMQRHGLVTSVWEPSASGPDRRVYALSGEGRQAAAGAARELQGVRDALSAALSRRDADARQAASVIGSTATEALQLMSRGDADAEGKTAVKSALPPDVQRRSA